MQQPHLSREILFRNSNIFYIKKKKRDKWKNSNIQDVYYGSKSCYVNEIVFHLPATCILLFYVILSYQTQNIPWWTCIEMCQNKKTNYLFNKENHEWNKRLTRVQIISFAIVKLCQEYDNKKCEGGASVLCENNCKALVIIAPV